MAMTSQGWRPMAADEADVVRCIITAADFPGSRALIESLGEALVRRSTPWILDVKTAGRTAVTGFPNGPFPARALVQDSAGYQGEIIVWLADGRVSGLEYAWVSDDAPSRWPRSDEMEVLTTDPESERTPIAGAMDLGLNGTMVQSVLIEFTLRMQLSDAYFIVIESPFRMELHGESISLSPDTDVEEAFDPARQLVGRTVNTATAATNGTLRIVFSDGTQLEVPPDETYEAWSVCGPHGALVVCTPRGRLATWSRDADS